MTASNKNPRQHYRTKDKNLLRQGEKESSSDEVLKEKFSMSSSKDNLFDSVPDPTKLIEHRVIDQYYKQDKKKKSMIIRNKAAESETNINDIL